jgi:hypothetical protein
MNVCRQCEYFDIGAMAMNGHGDCLNNRSPRFQTYQSSPACPVFHTSSTRECRGTELVSVDCPKCDAESAP